MRPLVQLLLAVLLCLPLGTAVIPVPDAGAQPTGGSVPGTGSIRIALLDIPADRVDDPRARSYIVDNIPPGGSITRRVQVTNNTGAPAVLDVYAGPAAIEDGSFVPRPRGESNPLSSWVVLSTSEVALDDGQSAEVQVTIAVPADAPEVEQYGAVWASTRPVDTGDGQQIAQVSRVGVRLYVSVGEGNGPPSDFTIVDLTARRDQDRTAAVVARVENTGGRAVDVSGTLALADGPGGLTAQAVSSSMVTIAPGGQAEVEFAIPSSAAFPAGPWTATADLASGWTEHSLTRTLEFPDGDQGGGIPVAVWAGIAAAVLILILVAALLLRRRARSDSDADS
ncbi:hypothetical protein NGF75_08440 [Dietzia kunjamensis]|uniref:hypothetical protein n=1 Tax=Dietzia kunjamensis TaxID=322509 RepID=UPI002DBD945C|nr:hypothetical protein [Dietzia kunjamensis]MEB8326014.1 hypothetical protein [Dietzia kunjamensis]